MAPENAAVSLLCLFLALLGIHFKPCAGWYKLTEQSPLFWFYARVFSRSYARIPGFKLTAQLIIQCLGPDLKQEMCSSLCPAHLLFLDHPLAHGDHNKVGATSRIQKANLGFACKCLSRKSHVRRLSPEFPQTFCPRFVVLSKMAFLGEGVAAMPRPYPTHPTLCLYTSRRQNLRFAGD